MNSSEPSFVDHRFISKLSLDDSVADKSGASLINSLISVKFCPARYAIGTKTSGSTLFSIIDNAAKNRNLRWIVRLDKAHKGHNYAHINVNKGLTKVADPHIPIPDGALSAASTMTNVVKYGGYVLLVASAGVTAYSLGKAMYDDVDERNTLGKRTVKTSASTAAGLLGGFGGALGGNSAGAVTGGAIGALFGGIGAVPGAAIGGIIGGLVGGVGGGVASSMAAEAITDKVYENLRLGKRGFIIKIDGKHLCILPNVSYKSDAKEDSNKTVEKKDEKKPDEVEIKAKIEAAEKEQNLKEWMEIIKQTFVIVMKEKLKFFTVSYEKQTLPALKKVVTQIFPPHYHHICKENIFTSVNYEFFITYHDSPLILCNICDLEEFKQSKFLISFADTAEIVLKDMTHFFKNYVPLPIIEDNTENEVSNVESLEGNSDSSDKLLGENTEASTEEQDLKLIFGIEHEALCMDETGNVLFWLNPKQGVRDAAILLEKLIPCLEIIS